MINLSLKNHAAALGNIIEWYDFALYGSLISFLSVSIFPPHQNNKLILMYLIFASGVVARFIGGLLFSHHGDTKNPQQALNTSIYLMAISTALIGLIPNYQQAGMIAPSLLLILRIIQGISAGGQYSGSLIILGNQNPLDRSQQCAFAYIYSTVGFLLANVMSATCTHIFAAKENHSLIWRIPFLLSIPLAIFVIRSMTSHTQSNTQSSNTIKNPLIT